VELRVLALALDRFRRVVDAATTALDVFEGESGLLGLLDGALHARSKQPRSRAHVVTFDARMNALKSRSTRMRRPTITSGELASPSVAIRCARRDLVRGALHATLVREDAPQEAVK